MYRSPRWYWPVVRGLLCLALTVGCALSGRAESAASANTPAGSTAAEAAAPRHPATGAVPAGTTAPASRLPNEPAGAGRGDQSGRAQAPVRPRQPAVNPEVAQLTATVAGLHGDVERLQDDREQLETANQRLTELNAQLRQEVESLALELQAARAGAWQRWLLYGAGLLLIGVLTGAIIKARPRRSAWS